MTLIELLITMAIMAIISAAILGTASAAMEGARRSRTQSLVTKINGLLTERLASYETRRVDIRQSILTAFASPPEGKQMADLRLLALRETIKFEMPDHWADVSDPEVFISRVPSLSQGYLRRLNQMQASGVDPADIARHQGAECLYLTIMHSTGDGEARTLFSKQDIGDVDGDGANEFVDGWGNPISWLRWPAGFTVKSPLMSADAQADHDPNDMYRRDDPSATPPATSYPTSPINVQKYVERLRDPMPAFRLVPLVYSSGPDASSDITTLGGDSVMNPTTIALDPYALDDPSMPYHVVDNPFQVGAPADDKTNPDGDDNSIDNIYSHFNEY